MTYFIIDTI